MDYKAATAAKLVIIIYLSWMKQSNIISGLSPQNKHHRKYKNDRTKDKEHIIKI